MVKDQGCRLNVEIIGHTCTLYNSLSCILYFYDSEVYFSISIVSMHPNESDFGSN